MYERTEEERKAEIRLTALVNAISFHHGIQDQRIVLTTAEEFYRFISKDLFNA